MVSSTRAGRSTGRSTVGRGAAVAALAVGGALAGVGAGVAAGSSGAGWEAPGDTIVRIAGDAANGFSVHFKDGSALYPPTDSEAFAECSEYDTRWQRARCRAEVRTWYRDLADTKRALAWQAELHRREMAEQRR